MRTWSAVSQRLAQERWLDVWDLLEHGSDNIYPSILRALRPLRRAARDRPAVGEALGPLVAACSQHAIRYLSPPVSVIDASSMLRATRRVMDAARSVVDEWLTAFAPWPEINLRIFDPWPAPKEDEPRSPARRLWDAYVGDAVLRGELVVEDDPEPERTIARRLVDIARASPHVKASQDVVGLFAQLAGDRFTEYDLKALVDFHRDRIDRWLYAEDQRERMRLASFAAARRSTPQQPRRRDRRQR